MCTWEGVGDILPVIILTSESLRAVIQCAKVVAMVTQDISHPTPPTTRSSHNADNLNPPRRNALSNSNVSFVEYFLTDSIGWGVNISSAGGSIPD